MKRVIVFGGRGFVGSQIVRQLNETKKYDVWTADGGDEVGKNLCRDITKFGNVMSSIKKGDIVINLVGLTPTSKPKKTTYELVHVIGAKNLVAVCKERGARLIEMSALGADPNGLTEYLRTKGAAEEAIRGSGIDYTIIRPSIIFDKQNELIKMMENASSSRFFPNFQAKFQPIHRSDVAKVFVLAVEGKIKEKTIELGGPEKLSLYEMAKIIFAVEGKKCYPIPLTLVKAGMYFFAAFGIMGIGRDQIKILHLDNTTDNPYPIKGMITFSEWAKKLK